MCLNNVHGINHEQGMRASVKYEWCRPSPSLSEADDCPKGCSTGRGAWTPVSTEVLRTQVCPCLTDRNLPTDDEKRVLPRSVSPSCQVALQHAALSKKRTWYWRRVLVAGTRYKIEIETCFDTQTRGWSMFAPGKEHQ